MTKYIFRVWVLLWDYQGNLLQQFGSHMGHYEKWKDVIVQSITKCLSNFGMDDVQVNGILRDFEVSKDHILKWEENRYGILNYSTKIPE